MRTHEVTFFIRKGALMLKAKLRPTLHTYAEATFARLTKVASAYVYGIRHAVSHINYNIT